MLEVVWVVALVVAILAFAGVDVEAGLWNAIRMVATVVAVGTLLAWVMLLLRRRRG